MYKGNSITLDEALHNNPNGVRIKTFDGGDYLFERIEEKFDGIYGYKWKKDRHGTFVARDNIKEIKVLNHRRTKVTTWVVGLGAAVIVLYLVNSQYAREQ